MGVGLGVGLGVGVGVGVGGRDPLFLRRGERDGRQDLASGKVARMNIAQMHAYLVGVATRLALVLVLGSWFLFRCCRGCGYNSFESRDGRLQELLE